MMRIPAVRNSQRSHRKGSAYLLVLGVTSLLVTLGLAAIQLATRQVERHAWTEAQAQTRLSALNAQDLVSRQLSGTTAWRPFVSNNLTYFLMRQGDGFVYFSLSDPIDGDVANDPLHAIRLRTLSVSGHTVRIYSAEYQPDEDGNLSMIPGTLQRETLAD